MLDKRKEHVYANIRLSNTVLDQTKEFCYLGSTIVRENKCLVEVTRRIAMAKQAFQQKKNLLTNSHLSVESRKKFIKAFVWSVLTYGCES